MKLPIAGAECPWCYKKLPLYNEHEYKYGSPIVTCKHCGKKYLDLRYHEMAIEGMPQSELNGKRYLVFGLICLIISIAGALFSFYYIRATGGRLILEIAFISPIAAIAAIFNFIELINVKTGAKQKRLERYMQASRERLKDQVYAAELEENGYKLPEN